MYSIRLTSQTLAVRPGRALSQRSRVGPHPQADGGHAEGHGLPAVPGYGRRVGKAPSPEDPFPQFAGLGARSLGPCLSFYT